MDIIPLKKHPEQIALKKVFPVSYSLHKALAHYIVGRPEGCDHVPRVHLYHFPGLVESCASYGK